MIIEETLVPKVNNFESKSMKVTVVLSRSSIKTPCLNNSDLDVELNLGRSKKSERSVFA